MEEYYTCQVVCQKICQIECQKHVEIHVIWLEPHEANSALTLAKMGANRSRVHGRDSQTR